MSEFIPFVRKSLTVVISLLLLQQNLTAQSMIDPIESVKVKTLYKGRDSGTAWFLPRVCRIPEGKMAKAFMTMQEITGSDYYGPVHWSESTDNGNTWTKPLPLEGFGRKAAQGETEEAVSDVILKYHSKTKSVLAIGEILYYKKGKFFKDQPPRYPVYIVRDKTGNWSERKKLEWNDPRNSSIYGIGSSQFVVLPDGDLIIPVMFRSIGRKDAAVTTLRCSFDGKTIRVKKVGVELNNFAARGFLEPQLVQSGKQFYLTIRAEDGLGYVSVSADGLDWSKPKPWAWETGEQLTMSTTQQHWLSHSDELYLVYTRKTASNANVMRWRSPLHMAKVNLSTMQLESKTERIIFPLIGDGINDPTHVPHYGNFDVANWSPKESWISSGEVIPANYRGNLLMARIIWKKSDNSFK